MNRRIWLSASVVFALVILLLSWSLLTAEAPKSPRSIPEGFSGKYVFIEKKDGGFVLLQEPEVRRLAGKTFLVGHTLPLDGITGDELFALTAQWVDMETIRRMGEFDDPSVFNGIQKIARRPKVASATK